MADFLIAVAFGDVLLLCPCITLSLNPVTLQVGGINTFMELIKVYGILYKNVYRNRRKRLKKESFQV